MRDKLTGLKRELSYHGEVKWRYFAPKNDDPENPMKTWDMAKRNEFRSRVFSIITKTKSCRIIACASETPTAYGLNNLNTQEDLYFRTYKPVTERFQYYLQDVARESGRDSFGLIVADHRGRGEDERMRSQHERLIRETGKYTSNYANFIEGLFFSPSHMSVGIQLADMVAGAIWRAQASADRTWFDIIKPSFRSSAGGQIDGFGLARLPKSGWQGAVLS